MYTLNHASNAASITASLGSGGRETSGAVAMTAAGAAAAAVTVLPHGAISFVGSGLHRPECVLATRAGDLYTADWRGGVARTGAADGRSSLVAQATLAGGRQLRPNGIALRADGSFLLADLGETQGGVFVLDRRGQVRPLLEEVDGIDLPPTNFVHEDRAGRTWITISTRHCPRASAYRADIADGFIVLLDARGARIVAEGLGYTNEALPSPDGRWLYVNETFGRRLSRFALRADGSLGPREVVTTFGAGTFPDGLAFDAEGAVWVTSIVSNRVIRVGADGAQSIVVEDCDAAHLAACEQAYRDGTMGRVHLDGGGGQVLRNISSLAFGGPDLRTAYLGCLNGDAIATFRAPVAGQAPVHWDW
jgi:sugar lactone lactonase YvrE